MQQRFLSYVGWPRLARLCRPPALLSVCLLVLIAQASAADRFIEIGTPSLALDQPRVAVEVVTTKAGHDISLGPEFSNTFLLDTGSSTVMAVGSAVAELLFNGYQTVATYDEQGVAGTTPMDVSAPYRLDFAGTNGQRESLDNVRLLSTQALNLGGFDGIVGMPAMLNRVITLDMSVWSDLRDFFMGVDFPDALPASDGHRYSVPLSMVTFPLDGQRAASDPLPTSVPLPFVPVTMWSAGHSINAQFILDTGAQLSIISTAVAKALQLDLNNPLFEIDVGGIGGTVTAPVVATDALALHAGGVDLVWQHTDVVVADVHPLIAGVLGMDFLSSDWLEHVFFGEPADGAVQKVHLDFSNGASLSGTMHLELTPQNDHQHVVGDANGDGQVTGADYSIWADHFPTTDGEATRAEGDFNWDGRVTGADYSIWADHFQPVAAALPVPEPATGITGSTAALFVTVPLLRRRRRRRCVRHLTLGDGSGQSTSDEHNGIVPN
ncbi:MAG: aspartyl protease family protein [Pirellulales bacterium]|nr:aspartyl protease family protein [Pirellulales bacterium]